MSVITISRQYGSGGDEIASRLSVVLGYQSFDKRQIVQAARDAGLSEQETVDYSEDSYQVQGFLDRLLGRPRTVSRGRFWREAAAGIRTTEEYKLSDDTAVALVQKAVMSACQMGDFIIVGRGGQVILKDQPGAFHLRIEGPIEERIQRVKEQLKASGQEYYPDVDARRAAQDLILEKDMASRDYIQRFYHVEWDDPLLYHIVLNTGKLSIEEAARLVTGWVQSNMGRRKETNRQALPLT